MAPKADGKVSRAAQFAHVAARLHGAPTREHGEWFVSKLKINLSQPQAERAVIPIRHVSPLKDARGRPGERKQKTPWAFREWLDVREERFDLIKVLITIEGAGDAPRELSAQLEALPGIRQIIEGATTRNLTAVALLRNVREEDRLRARIEELTERRVIWEHIRSETTDPALATWRELARAQARDEGMLRSGSVAEERS